MPTYEYECSQCRHHFEELQKFTDKALVQCPKCGGKLIRLISGGTGLIFKGSGFYITDYKRKELATTKETKKELQKPKDKPSLPTKT